MRPRSHGSYRHIQAGAPVNVNAYFGAFISPIHLGLMVYGDYIYSFRGDYKPTHITRGGTTLYMINVYS